MERLQKQSAYFENEVRKLEGKLATFKAPFEAQIRDLTAKIKVLEGDPNAPKPVEISQAEFERFKECEAEAIKLKVILQGAEEAEIKKMDALSDNLNSHF